MATPQLSTPSRSDDPLRFKKLHAIKNIEDVMRKFKRLNLTSDVILSLFEVTQDEIHEHLNELKLKPTKINFIKLLSDRAQDFSLQELHECYFFLQLYATAFSKTKIWRAIRLLEPAEDLEIHDNLRLIERNILQAFRIKGLNAFVKVIRHEELIWLLIVEKKLTRKKGVKLKPPVFVCYEVGTPFIFSGSPIPPAVMECLLKAMQYNRQKTYQLQGRHIKSLLAVLKKKKEIVVFQPGGVEIGHNTINYSNRKAHENYANALFNTGEDIYLDTFKVQVEAEWRGNDLVPSMEGKPIVASMELRSKNIIDMIKYAISNDIVATPLPEYLQSILRSGKTKIDMRVAKN